MSETQDLAEFTAVRGNLLVESSVMEHVVLVIKDGKSNRN